jgi:2-methylisocitrate lyase-like PEP mutase family enzyme
MHISSSSQAAAVAARRNPDFLIIARTDARNAIQFGGKDAGEQAFEEGIQRLKAAFAAGADMAFMESPRGKEECGRLVKALDGHLTMINVLPDVRFLASDRHLLA